MDYSVYCNLNHSDIDWVAIFVLVVAIISVIVAIVSVRIAVKYNRKTLELTQIHNKKSVEPLLTIRYSSLQNTDIPNCGEESFTLTNCGFGPALIKSFHLIWGNKAYGNMFGLYKEFNKEPRYMEGVSTALILSNTIIASNESLLIFKFYFAKRVPFQEDYFDAIKFHDLAKEVSLKIEFVTIYGEKRFYDVKSITD
jgi:hypothetical protein